MKSLLGPRMLVGVGDARSTVDTDATPGVTEVAEGGRPEEAAMRLLLGQFPVILWTTDSELRVSWGMKSPGLQGVEHRLARWLETGSAEIPAVAAHRRALRGEAASFELEWKARSLKASVVPYRDAAGAIAGTAGVALAVSVRRGLRPAVRNDDPRSSEELQEQLLHATLYDGLTNLASRSLFLARLRRSVAPEWCKEGLFVLLVDIDRFHEVNARCGYPAGDQVLAEVGARLKRKLRPVDLVARVGPDRFGILVGGFRGGQDVAQVAERLRDQVAAPFEIAGRELKISASVGVAMGTPGARPEDIVREAEMTLARAKLLGQGGAPLIEGGDPREGPLQRVELALRRALDQEEFRSRYRPTLLRKEGSVASFEVLLFRRGAGASTT